MTMMEARGRLQSRSASILTARRPHPEVAVHPEDRVANLVHGQQLGVEDGRGRRKDQVRRSSNNRKDLVALSRAQLEESMGKDIQR